MSVGCQSDFRFRIWLKMHHFCTGKFKKKFLRAAARTMRAGGAIFCTPHFSDESYAPGTMNSQLASLTQHHYQLIYHDHNFFSSCALILLLLCFGWCSFGKFVSEGSVERDVFWVWWEWDLKRLRFKLATLTHNTLCSTQPAYLHSFLITTFLVFFQFFQFMCQIKLAACLSVFQCKSSIVSYRIPRRSLESLYALQTPTCCLVLVFALPLPPVVLVLQPPQSGTHSHLAFATLLLPIPFVALNSLLPAGFWLPLATHPSASDATAG